MVPLTAQKDLSSMEIVGLIHYTQRIRVRGEGFGEHLEAHRPALWAAG